MTRARAMLMIVLLLGTPLVILTLWMQWTHRI